MRRSFVISSLAVLTLLLLGTLTMRAQDEATTWTTADLESFQAVAETYYEEGVDENALLGERLNGRFAIAPGMYMTDFTLRDLEGVPYTLSEQRGQKFVLIVNGSWW